jgi:hypothetical protein
MDARTYLDTHGVAGVEALRDAVKAAVPGREFTVGYFKQIAYGYRRPSPELAEAMVENDPKGQLDFMALIKARERKPTGGEGHAAS